MNKIGFILLFLLTTLNTTSQVRLNYNQENHQMTMDCNLQSHAQWSIGIGGNGIIVEVTDKFGNNNVLFNSIGCSQYSIITKENSVIIDIFCFPEILYPSDCACEDQPKPDSDSADLKFNIVLTPDTIFGKMTFSLHDFSMPNWINNESSINNIEESIPYYYGMVPCFLKEFDTVDSLLLFITKYDNVVKEKNLQNNYAEYKYYRDFFRTIIPYMETSSLSFKDLVHISKCMKTLFEENNQRRRLENYGISGDSRSVETQDLRNKRTEVER